MVLLSQVLGGLLKDVAQSRVAADLLSAELAKQYQANATLAGFPVPRFTIKEVSVDLQFAVQQTASEGLAEAQESELGRLLVGQLEAKVMSAQPGAIAKGLRASDLRGLATARGTELVTKSLELVTRSWTGTVAARPKAADIERFIAQDLPRLRQVAAARAATEMDLDVEVRSSQIPANQPMQTLRLVLSSDDVEAFTPPSVPLPPAPWAIRQLLGVEGIGAGYVKKLQAAGLRTYGELWAADVKSVAAAAGVSPKLVQAWRARIDLERVPGVDAQGAELLTLAGVRDAIDLAARDPPALLKALDAARGGRRRAAAGLPDLGQLTSWIGDARRLAGGR